MKNGRMTWLAIAAVSAALSLAGCQKKDQLSVTREPSAKSELDQAKAVQAQADQAQALNDQTAPESGTATTMKDTLTEPGTAVGDPAKPMDQDAEAAREQAATAAADRLAKLDSRVTDIRAHVDQFSNKPIFTDTLTDLKRLHETAQAAIDSMRDPSMKLDDARQGCDRRMTQFEAAINSLQKRVERVESETGA